MVCNDAGARHVAKAFERPVVTIFGPTHPGWTDTHYPLEHAQGGALYAAHQRYREILQRPQQGLPSAMLTDIKDHIKGLLPQTFQSIQEVG